MEACEVCFKEGPVKKTVKSIRHSHLTASKVQKVVMGLLTFKNVTTGKNMALCEECQVDVIQGMSSGGMYE